MRAGVFLCECGGNISGVVDLEPLAEHARSLDGVVEVDDPADVAAALAEKDAGPHRAPPALAAGV